MIYPWYNEDRWFSERFTGSQDRGRQLLAEYCLSPGKAHFRHSYASFRVNGLQYACMLPDGRVQYGIRRAPLKVELISPRDLVGGLDEMFRILADAGGAAGAVDQWISSTFAGPVASFFRHVARHHQAEHWLESKILVAPRLLFTWIDQMRSQVDICEQGEKSKGFIDLLGADHGNRVLWVIELKASKADKRAIGQARAYAVWVRDHIAELLDEDMSYFGGTGDPWEWTVAVGFVAPGFTKNFANAVAQQLPEIPVQVWQVNAGWRTAIHVDERPSWRRRDRWKSGEVAGPMMS